MASMAATALAPQRLPSLYDQVLPKLRPFQREALEFAVNGKRYDRQVSPSTAASNTKTPNAQFDPSLLGKGRILLADEMGLGKSLTSLAIMACYESEWPLLILCPASLRYIWPAEIEKFLPSIPPKSIYVVSGFLDIAFTKRNDVKVVVVTYSLLQERSAVRHALEEFHFQCIIVDESHNLKQKNSQRSQILLPLLRKARRLVLLSGTPALARPAELWTQLSCLAPTLFGNWTTFTRRFCDPKKKSYGGDRFVWDFGGSSNEAELHAKLKNIMVRRLKCDVLSELPPKQRSIVPVPIARDRKAACEQAMTELKDSRASVKELFGNEARQADFEAKSKLMAAYQTSGIGKAQPTADYLLDWLEGCETQKILVFAHHKAVLDIIDQTLLAKRPNSHIRIDGSVPTELRGQLVRKFQTCDRIRVGLLSMTAAGVGLTLTAASTVLFAELHWTPGVLAQAEDRAHRLGTKADSVQIIYMVCNDREISVDRMLWEMLGNKIGTLDQVVDGKEDKPYLYNAKETEFTSAQSQKRQSVQDELQAFFAETGKTREKVPVKGSIERFFIKKGNTKEPETSIPVSQTPVSDQAVPTANALPGTASVADDTLECPRCTLLNDRASVSSMCEACGYSRLQTARKPQSQNKSGDGERRIPNRSLPQVLMNPSTVVTASVAKKQSHDSDSELEDYFYTPIFESPSSKVKASQCSASGTLATEKGNARKQSLSNSPADVTWICSICTFENKAQRTQDHMYYCELCGDLYSLLHDQFASDRGSAGSSSSKEFVLGKNVLQSTCETPYGRSTVSNVVTVVETGNRKRPTPAASEVIVLDCAESPPPKKPAAMKTAIEVIDMLSDSDADELASGKGVVRPQSSCAPDASFSASKNSGRITIHLGRYRDSTLVNFCVEEVVSSDTADRLLDSRTKNRGVPSKPFAIDFDDDKLDKVIGLAQSSSLAKKCPVDALSLSNSLKNFIRAYLSLREIERKVLSDHGEPITADEMPRRIASLLTHSGQGTERYVGGAKERAKERLLDGSVTEEDHAILDGQACSWCGAMLSRAARQAQSSYCSQACAEEGRLKRGGMYASANLRAAVFALERGNCTNCRLDCHSLYEQVKVLPPPARLNKLLSVNWKLPKSAKALESLLQDPLEGDFWQVDHIRAVAEGGGGCGLDNLRTLCVPCHLAETETLRSRLRLQSPPKDNSVGASNKRQLRISSYLEGPQKFKST